MPEEYGMVCSVREAGLAVVAIVSSAKPPIERDSSPHRDSRRHQRIGLNVDVEVSENYWK